METSTEKVNDKYEEVEILEIGPRSASPNDMRTQEFPLFKLAIFMVVMYVLSKVLDRLYEKLMRNIPLEMRPFVHYWIVEPMLIGIGCILAMIFRHWM